MWIPHYDGASSPGVGNRLERPPLPARAAALPLPWPFGPHVAGYKYKAINVARPVACPICV